MAYATVPDLTLRYDARAVGDLCSDEGTSVSVAGLDAHPVVDAALDDASGTIDAALMVGGQYTPTDLANLTGNSLSTLVRITCDLAMVNLLQRRGFAETDRLKAMRDLAESQLERLRQGINVFNIPDRGPDTIGTTGPTVVEFGDLNLLPDRTRHYFPARPVQRVVG